jgi:class 3 adenylate cyclase
MRCSKCDSDNREGRKFCANCAAPLTITCSKCGATNEAGEKFCGECAAPQQVSVASAIDAESLAVIGNAARPPIAASSLTEGERKTITALFADIKGSTELMRDLDPEEARAIIDPALRMMIDAVKRYDGYVVQSTGDGIFALFGAPAAYEDHPQRALYAALLMQQEFREHGERRAAAGAHRPEARVGINTGEVVVRSVETGGRFEYTPIGHTLNLARLLRDTHHVDEARTMLSDIYSWFTGGFDLPDLEEAKDLLSN